MKGSVYWYYMYLHIFIIFTATTVLKKVQADPLCVEFYVLKAAAESSTSINRPVLTPSGRVNTCIHW
jgi:hypothetical protein